MLIGYYRDLPFTIVDNLLLPFTIVDYHCSLTLPLVIGLLLRCTIFHWELLIIVENPDKKPGFEGTIRRKSSPKMLVELGE